VPDLEAELELQAGFRIFALPFAPNLGAVFIWGEELGACVGLNADLPLPRRRASLAHELGHFLRDPEAGDVLLAVPPGSEDPAERFCDAFARELLMSAEGLRRRVSRLRRLRGGQLTVGDLVTLAGAYEVSFQAMTLRLEELAVLEPGTYESIEQRGLWPQAAEEEPKYEAQRRQLRQLEGYSRRYLQLTFEAYDAALLSEGELAHFLHCDRTVARVASLRRRMVVDDQGHGLDLDFARPLNGKGSKSP
jgi:Zn-dependent peptidase ImmA (M78 family)